MSKVSAKTGSNMFYKARMEASAHNERFSSRDGASEEMAMDRGRLFRIESGITDPHPEEVLMMSNLYGKPELENYFCKNCCPLGYTVPEAKVSNLDRITIETLSAIQQIEQIKNDLIKITADGEITKNEITEFNHILATLENIQNATEGLKLWARKNLREA